MNTLQDRHGVLVTGASGFVGGHIALSLASRGFRISAAGGRQECPVEVRCAAEDLASLNLPSITEIERLLCRTSPDVIIHAAALASPAACERDPSHANAVNTESVQDLVRAALQLQPRPLIIQISTDLVFDGVEAPTGGFTESHAPCPATVYGRTKLAAERILLEQYEKSVVLRICLVFGEALGERQGFLSWTLEALRQSKPLILFEDEFRTPVYVGDIGEVISRIISLTDDNRDHPCSLDDLRILHIPGPERLSRFEFCRRLTEFTGYSERLLVPESIRNRAAGMHRSADVSLSGDKIKKKLSIRMTPIDSGLRRIFGDLYSKPTAA